MPPLRFGIYERRLLRPCGYPKPRNRWWWRRWWWWWWGQEASGIECGLEGRGNLVAGAVSRWLGKGLELGRVPDNFCLKLFAILINVHALRTVGQFGWGWANGEAGAMNKMWAYLASLADDVAVEKVKHRAQSTLKTQVQGAFIPPHIWFDLAALFFFSFLGNCCE